MRSKAFIFEGLSRRRICRCQEYYVSNKEDVDLIVMRSVWIPVRTDSYYVVKLLTSAITKDTEKTLCQKWLQQ